VARNQLVLGLAAVFAGLTAVLAIAALARQPFLLAVALPFAATTYLLWSHATGRLARRARRRGAARARGAGADQSEFGERIRDQFGGAGPAGRGPRQAASAGQADAHSRGAGNRRRRAADRGAGRQRTRGKAGSPLADRYDITPAEARRLLGVSPEADQEAIKEAYRKQVKQTHPDTADGDEESFKRLNQAYERLKEE
jgi:DnaJ-domain-containing protein 1